MEYTRLFLNETENVEKANPIIYALFCAVGISANLLIIIGKFSQPSHISLLSDLSGEGQIMPAISIKVRTKYACNLG